MRKVAAAAGAGAQDKYEYFFQVGANAKDEISLECGAFTMEGIMSMANEGVAQGQQIKFAGNEADAGKNNQFGLVIVNGETQMHIGLYLRPSAAQRTLATIDKFIETVDSKRAARRRNPKSYGKHHP